MKKTEMKESERVKVEHLQVESYVIPVQRAEWYAVEDISKKEIEVILRITDPLRSIVDYALWESVNYPIWLKLRKGNEGGLGILHRPRWNEGDYKQVKIVKGTVTLGEWYGVCYKD